ncbi:MAG: MFS transporter [Alphaproteobacteria bacterium]|nr:MFS transporter [Alphaproteobacteria bacterium]
MAKSARPARAFAPGQWNLIYLLSAAGGLVATLAVAVQPLLLDGIFGIAFEKEGRVNADIQVVAEIVSILCVGWFGMMSDRIGRVPVIAGGFLAILVGAVLSLVSVEMGLMLGGGALLLFYVTRVLISSGADTVQLQLLTLVGDVSTYENRPGLLRNVVFMMVFGGTVLSAVVMQIATQAVGVFVILMVPLAIGAAGLLLARRHLVEVAPPPIEGDHPLRQVWATVSADPRMQLAFAAAFYSRADLIVVSLFFSLWCISLSDVVGVTRAAATSHAAVMIGVLGAGLIASVPLWKVFIERHSRMSAIGASLSLAAMGYFGLGLFVNPYNWLIAAPLLLIAVGHAGSAVALKVLTVDISPKPILGSMLGAIYLTGGAGIVLLVQSGGYYFDAVGPRAPFILMGTGKLLVTLFAGWLLIHGIDETSDHHMKSGRKVDWKPLVFLTSALPVIWLVGRGLIGGYVSDTLAETPVGFINRYLGDWAFTFLLISLALRPVQEMTGIKQLARYRRMIGLYAFFYAALHVIAYVALEWAFNLDDMIGDVVERPFIVLGVAAFGLLIPLAWTSRNAQINKLGGKRWKALHRVTYAVNIAVALHFVLAATHENGEPYIYAAVLAALLGYRVRQWRIRRAEASA